MYVSRLTFHTMPRQTGEVEQQFLSLQAMVANAGVQACRVFRTRYASLGAPDIVFEQDAMTLPLLNGKIEQVAKSDEFRAWSEGCRCFWLNRPNGRYMRS